uniref:Ig-like domain-containing protein n=1 Tax=Sinocyclocheilus anshuiensis TaxID=1608454 RepID=A0A671PE18_9TELE
HTCPAPISAKVNTREHPSIQQKQYYSLSFTTQKDITKEITASERDQVIVRCNYFTTGINIYLFWYKQLPNKSPTLILNQYTTEPDFKKRFSATLNSSSRTFPLMIKNLRVSDSAVYYCALRPTVTKTHSTLIQKQRKCSVI